MALFCSLGSRASTVQPENSWSLTGRGTCRIRWAPTHYSSQPVAFSLRFKESSMPTSYDELPYQSVAFAQTHPDRLATVATLLGLEPPRVDKCRVLELGCAAGGNPTPIAESLPEAKFVGIHLTARQVADGKQIIARLGLGNIQLQQGDIAALRPDLGTFDYIICHGVFSWVPKAVQDAIFTICKQCLAPDGVAFVSYNTLPGWRMRGMIRDMMLYHAAQFSEPRRKVEQGLALIDFLVQSSATQQ